MKFHALLFMLLIVFYGCQTGSLTSPDSAVYPVNIHMQSGFADDSVLFSIDGQIILNGNFTTDPIILICGSAKIDLPPGQNTLVARVPQHAVATQSLFTSD
jgi:hypothetical protein